MERAPATIAGRPAFFCAVAALSAAMIASQVAVMRVFAIGNWAHFGSLVIAIAMAGFGLASSVMCIAPAHFERRAARWATGALIAFGPLLLLGNAGAQSLAFNPVFLAAGSQQSWLLLGVVGFYFLPFFAAAMFLGSAFLIGARDFGRVYFADLAGAGLAGLLFLGALSLIRPTLLLIVPLGLWFLAGICWSWTTKDRVSVLAMLVLGALCGGHVLQGETIATSPYKGVAYARNFPDARRIYEDWGPQGYLEIYASSYFHFAPGLSDIAAIDLPNMPEDAYFGMYIDGDGPIGVMKPLGPQQRAYFRYLPMAMPFLIRPHAETFVAQFGGGIATRVALGLGAKHVVAAEPNPLIRRALASPAIAPRIGNLLSDPQVTIIGTEGRIAAADRPGRFDVVDLSLIDSTGLSSPGGLSVVEKYAYSREAMLSYMRALKPDGILSVTVWNKENPPKAVPRLFETLIQAARDQDKGPVGNRFFIVHTYLSTATILYRRGGFTPAELGTLTAHAKHMSFDVVWPSVEPIDAAADATLLKNWSTPFPADAASADTGGVTPEDDGSGPEVDSSVTGLYRAMLHGLMAGKSAEVQETYGFQMTPVTDERPYLAGYIKPADLLRALAHFDLISDDWGFLLLWVSLGQSLLLGAVLIVAPVIFGWRTIFSRQPGKIGLLGYFACLGLGYMLVEITLIAKFVRAFDNPTVSAAVMLTGMLVLSGTGALASTRIQTRCRRVVPPLLLGLAGLLAIYATGMDRVIDWIAGLSDPGRLAAALIAAGVPAFLMGFAMPTAMTELKLLGKEPFFLWAWAINGLFSVAGAVAAPLIGVLFGLDTALWLAALSYVLAALAFFSVLRPAPLQAAR